MWSKVFDIPTYLAAIGLFAYGILGMLRSEQPAETGNSPLFYIICSLFVVMFIFGARRSRRLEDRANGDEK
jgi:hypothetical protein